MNKRKNLNHNGSVQIISPFNLGNYRVYRYIYYCKFAWKFKKIKIKDKFENDNSDVLIIDRESVNNFVVSDNLKKYKIFICLWNGVFDKRKKIIIDFEKKLKAHKIEYNFFLVGYNSDYLYDEKNYFISDKITANKDFTLDCPLKYKIIFFFPNIFFLLKNIFNLKNFFKFFFISQKVFFVGGGILSPFMLRKNFSGDENFEENLIIKNFYYEHEKKNSKTMLINLKKFILSKKFVNLSYHQKIFIFQRISRHIFLSKLNKFEHFIHMNREFNIGLLNSTLFSKHYFLDFGSSVGYGLYDRSFILYKNHRQKTIKIDFIRNQKNFIKSYRRLSNLILKIDNFKKKNTSASKIVKIIAN